MRYNMKKAKKKKSQQYNIHSLKDKATIQEVVDALGIATKYGWTRSGESLKGNCPTGHASQSGTCFSIDLPDNLFHCYSCNVAGDIITLVEVVKDIDTKEAIQWLAVTFDQAPSLATAVDLGKDSEREIGYYEYQDLYKLILEHGKDMLYNSPAAQVVRDYLSNDRGYDLNLLKTTDFIYWDTAENIRSFLIAKIPDQIERINRVPLIGGFGDKFFRLAIPFRDMYGAITGFLKRAHVAKGFDIGDRKEVRWDSTKALKKADLFGMNRIKKGQDSILVVEGYPDATYLPAVGIENVVALGQAGFSEHYISALEAREVKRIIVSLDNDPGKSTGFDNTEKICRLLNGHEIQVFVIDPHLLGTSKDPDEYVKANGIAAMQTLMDNAELGSTWMVKRMLTKSPLTTDLEREIAIGDVLEYCDTLESVREAEMGLQQLSATLSLTDDILRQEFQRLKDRKAAEILQEGLQEVSQSADELLKDGKVEEALKTFQDTVASLQSEYWRGKELEAESFDNFLTDKKQRDSARSATDRLGYQLDDFAEIDKVLKGLQAGLYIVAADPNIGKTAFQVSLMLDVLKSNKDVSCLFYSMDDSRDMIVNRILAHLMNVKINEVRYKLDDPVKQKDLDVAYQLLADWHCGKRLDIHEGTAGLTMTRIASQIREHARRDKLVVFIDGLYNVPLDDDPGNIRVENIERANQVKRIVREFNLPMIVTAEFRKQGREEKKDVKYERTNSDIMESGKYGYNADLIILLTPQDADSYGHQDNPIIIANFSKNKLESFRGSMEFEFIRAKSVMKVKSNSTVAY